MFRGKTTRAVISLLATALLALQLFTPAGTFASAHIFHQVEAKAQPGIKSSSKPVHDGSDTFRDLSCPGDPAGPPHTRHRQRTAACGWDQERPLPARERVEAQPVAAPHGTHHRTARPGRSLSPAALQVFRC
ncbi:hypothetical protein [Streptomyces sp. NPDC001843]|uniref:hypothetical protein n=1 Tax=Streptomyces sp. NPDC001843 TaxID=3364617 RepID=UPI0036883E9F